MTLRSEGMFQTYNDFIKKILGLKENEYVVKYERHENKKEIMNSGYTILEYFTVHNESTNETRTIENSRDVIYLTDRNEDEVENIYIGQ